MTILTKPFNDKKGEKTTLPLFADGPVPSAPLPSISGETDSESVIFHRRRMSSATTIFLFLSAIAVMCMGILGGVAIYRLYAPSQDRLRFHGYYGIPYESETLHKSELLKLNDDLSSSFWNFWKNASQDVINPFENLLYNDLGDTIFREELELDLSDDQSYAKINVPDFKDGRRGRFMHDFKANQSAIIDNDALRCFIMPLDRDTVLPPRSLLDLLNKMWTGYYDINTDRVRKNMRVITPEITDMSAVSPKISHECIGMKIYLLEKYVNGVFKRSIGLLTDSGKFAEFSGRNIVEFNLLNIKEIEELEERQKLN